MLLYMNSMASTAIKLTPVNRSERKNLDMRAGDTVRVWVKIPEKDKIRLQAFEGLVLARKHGAEIGATFTVRKVSSGVGVERIFSLYSPVIDRIEFLKRTKVRKSKLYYVREKVAREIRRKMRTERTAMIQVMEAAKEEEKAEEVKAPEVQEAKE